MTRCGICSVADKIQPRHAQALFVHRIIVKGIVLCHQPHTDDGIVVRLILRVAKAQGVVPGGNHDLVAVRNFIIQGAAKIKTGRLIGCCCAHRRGSFLFYHYSIPSFSLQFSNCMRWLDGIGHTLYNKGRFMGRDLYEVACARFLSGFCVHCRRLPGLLLPRLGGGCGPGVHGVLPHSAGE